MTGTALKQLGLYRVESHNQALVGLARSIAREQCVKYGSTTIDLVRQDPRIAEFKPSNPNMYGSIFRGKEWHCIGWEPSTLKSNHSRFIRRWRFNKNEVT